MPRRQAPLEQGCMQLWVRLMWRRKQPELQLLYWGLPGALQQWASRGAVAAAPPPQPAATVLFLDIPWLGLPAAGRAPAVDARMQARLRHQRRRGSAECSPAKSRAAPDGTGGKERESRGDEGSCLRGRLPGPRRRPDRLTGVGSRLRLFPGWPIGPQTRIPFVGGAGIAHCDGRCGTDAGRMGCIGIRSAAVGSGKLRDRRSNRVSFNDRSAQAGSIGRRS
ncbi:g381 [Coccomyxa elongata]